MNGGEDANIIQWVGFSEGLGWNPQSHVVSTTYTLATSLLPPSPPLSLGERGDVKSSRRVVACQMYEE